MKWSRGRQLGKRWESGEGGLVSRSGTPTPPDPDLNSPDPNPTLTLQPPNPPETRHNGKDRKNMRQKKSTKRKRDSNYAWPLGHDTRKKTQKNKNRSEQTNAKNEINRQIDTKQQTLPVPTLRSIGRAKFIANKPRIPSSILGK